MIEEATTATASPALVAIKGGKGRLAAFETLAAETVDAPRSKTGIAELDRVLGGGLVPGSAVLVGGDPGIGKSTLLLQAAAELAQDGARVVYLSGEEAPAQVRMRAARLGLAQAPVALGTETNIASIIATLGSAPAPALVIIDSVQTLWSEGIDTAPGTISQLRGLRRRADQLRQDQRIDSRARGPCDQGRPDRRPQSDRAHGRHGPLFREPRAAISSASCAR